MRQLAIVLSAEWYLAYTTAISSPWRLLRPFPILTITTFFSCICRELRKRLAASLYFLRLPASLYICRTVDRLDPELLQCMVVQRILQYIIGRASQRCILGIGLSLANRALEQGVVEVPSKLLMAIISTSSAISRTVGGQQVGVAKDSIQ